MRPPHAVRLRLPLLALCALLAAAPACRSLGAGDPDTDTDAVVSDVASLRVINENFSDVDIFILRSGLRTRLGRVLAGRTQHFRLSPAQLGSGDLALLAIPAFGSGGVSSGSLVVSGGQSVEFRIMPVISQSVAVVQ